MQQLDLTFHGRLVRFLSGALPAICSIAAAQSYMVFFFVLLVSALRTRHFAPTIFDCCRQAGFGSLGPPTCNSSIVVHGRTIDEPSAIPLCLLAVAVGIAGYIKTRQSGKYGEKRRPDSSTLSLSLGLWSLLFCFCVVCCRADALCCRKPELLGHLPDVLLHDDMYDTDTFPPWSFSFFLCLLFLFLSCLALSLSPCLVAAVDLKS
jgi:hypothetical protein